MSKRASGASMLALMLAVLVEFAFSQNQVLSQVHLSGLSEPAALDC